MVLRGIGFALALALGALAVWLIVTGRSQKRLEIGVLAGLWGLLLGAFSMFGARRGEHDAAPSSAELAVRETGRLERADDIAARREWEARLERLITHEVNDAVGREVGALRREVTQLRQELLEKVGGQLRLERIETTRVIGSDLEALQAEVRQLKAASENGAGADYLAAADAPRIVRQIVSPAQVRPVSRPTADVEADVRPARRDDQQADSAPRSGASPLPGAAARSGPPPNGNGNAPSGGRDSRPSGDNPSPSRPDQAAEQARQFQARQEQARQEQARQEQARQEQARAEAVRAEAARRERARLAAEQAKAETARQERAEKERAEKERAEKERAEKERAEKERAEKERAERQRAERESAASASDPFASLPRLSRFTDDDLEPSESEDQADRHVEENAGRSSHHDDYTGRRRRGAQAESPDPEDEPETGHRHRRAEEDAADDVLSRLLARESSRR